MSKKELEIIARTHEQLGMCITAERLKEDLQKLGVYPGITLVVHCSLSKIGWICGGPVTVIQVLLDLLGPEGTLAMPSHTADNSDPKDWQNPAVPSEWFDTIRQSMPPYQASVTPTFNMGKVAETFRHWPGVQRSEHPLYSFMALGPKAEWITRSHLECCGEQSPLARLYQCKDNGYVLLLGVQHRNNSSIHLGEYRFQKNNHIKQEFIVGASIVDSQSNTRQWFEWNDYDYPAEDFNDLGNAFDSIEGNTQIGQVGLAQSRLMKQYLLVDFATHWFNNHRSKQQIN